jgi:iron complex transport system ATP-binding protein
MIEARGLRFSYNGKPVLTDVDLRISKGEVVGIVGPNGSGKSTLLKCLDGTLRSPPGTVFVEGRDIRGIGRSELARTVSTVAQETGFDFEYTVLEVVSMGRYPHLGMFEFESPSHASVVRQALKYVRAWHLRDKPITRISGGEKQRVLIAQALAQEPRVLLLDEPTKDLDIRHALDVMGLVKTRSRKNGLTVAAVLHDLDLVLRYCTKCVLLKKGRVQAFGPPRRVITPGNVQAAFGVRVSITGDHVRAEDGQNG